MWKSDENEDSSQNGTWQKYRVRSFFRCFSISTALEDLSGAEIVFVLNESTFLLDNKKTIISEKFDEDDINMISSLNPDLIICDSYRADSLYIRKLGLVARLILFDDNNDLHEKVYADILINGNLYATDLNYDFAKETTIKLLGPQYLAMKPEYWNEQLQNSRGEGILVTTGGSDPHRLMPKFIAKLKELPIKKRIIIGPAYEEEEILEIKKIVSDSFEIIHKPRSLKKYIEQSKIVLTAASTTVYEVLTLRKIPIIYSVAKNQIMLENTLKNYGVKSLGWYEEINWEKFGEEIKMVLCKLSYFREKLNKLYCKFDTKG
ncbi:MAG TPA: hypothetical protein ENF81_07515 [Thermotogaceae bacterium]|nr:hypothetical protein [Thermotogaceae bacterium]